MERDVEADRADAGGNGSARDRAAAVRSLEDALQRFGEKQPWVLAGLGILAVAVIGILDGLSGYEFWFSPFYLIPITIAAFYGGRKSGVVVAVTAAGAWFLADSSSQHPYANALAIYWNTGVRLLIFMIIALMLTRLKENRRDSRRRDRRHKRAGSGNDVPLHTARARRLSCAQTTPDEPRGLDGDAC